MPQVPLLLTDFDLGDVPVRACSWLIEQGARVMGNVSLLDAIKLSAVNPNCSAVQAARALGICFGDDSKAAPWSYDPNADTSAACAGPSHGVMGLPKPDVAKT